MPLICGFGSRSETRDLSAKRAERVLLPFARLARARFLLPAVTTTLLAADRLAYRSQVSYLSNFLLCFPAMSPKPGAAVDMLPSLQEDGRPSSAPPSTSPRNHFPSSLGASPPVASAIPPATQRLLSESGTIPRGPSPELGPEPLDLMPQLLRSGPSVVKTRTGSVLSRGFILKTDYWPSGKSSVRFVGNMIPVSIADASMQVEPWISN